MRVQTRGVVVEGRPSEMGNVSKPFEADKNGEG